MQCPTCNGQGYLLTDGVPEHNKKLTCHDCDGSGYINPPTGNNCPACGEQIPIGDKWCEYHKAAEQIEKEFNQ